MIFKAFLRGNNDKLNFKALPLPIQCFLRLLNVFLTVAVPQIGEGGREKHFRNVVDPHLLEKDLCTPRRRFSQVFLHKIALQRNCRKGLIAQSAKLFLPLIIVKYDAQEFQAVLTYNTGSTEYPIKRNYGRY